MPTMTAAAHNYATRPQDERYTTVDELIAAAEHDRVHSKEVVYNAKDLLIVPNHDANNLMIQSPKGKAEFTHWSFSQLCRSVGAPANYLRSLPQANAANDLNWGLRNTPAGTDLNLLVKANGCTPVVRACTSDTYGRVWDSQLYSAIQQQILSHDPQWLNGIPTWEGTKAGWYRGDRDSFGITVNGGSIVNDPSAGTGGNDGTMYRGILVSNSETGSSAITLETIYFRVICGNHMLWGAVLDKRYRRRHVGTRVLRNTIREISRVAWDWTNASAARDEAIISGLISHEIATTREGVVDELRKLGATKDQAEQAYTTCEVKENASPRSYWGLAQGLTRVSQESGYQDSRYELDQLAAKVLARGAQLVRV